MASVSGRDLKGTTTWASGKTARLKAMVFTLGRTAIDTKESGRTVSSMDRGRTSFRTVTFTRVIMNMENQMALASTSGATGLLMSEISEKASSLAKESGKRMKIPPVISMKDISTQI